MPKPTRRAVLASSALVAAAVAGGALGTVSHIHHKVAVPPAQPPRVLIESLAAHRTLLAGYAALAAAAGAPAFFGSLQAEVSEHVAALLAVLEAYPGWRYRHLVGGETVAPTGAAAAGSVSPAPASSGAPAPTTQAQLVAAIQARAAALSSACVRWPASDTSAAGQQVVPLLGSMSACLTGHAGLLA